MGGRDAGGRILTSTTHFATQWCMLRFEKCLQQRGAHNGMATAGIPITNHKNKQKINQRSTSPRLHQHTLAPTHANTRKHTQTHANTRKHTQTHENTRKHTKTRKHTQTHENTREHIQMHTETLAHTQTKAHKQTAVMFMKRYL